MTVVHLGTKSTYKNEGAAPAAGDYEGNNRLMQVKGPESRFGGGWGWYGGLS